MNTKTRVNWRLTLASIFDKTPDLKAPIYYEQLGIMLGDRAPGLSSVQKELIKLRDNYKKSHGSGGLDVSWNLGLLKNHPEILPEAIAKIFEMKAKGRERITIRQIIWIQRLSALPISVRVLWAVAFRYATFERICEISGINMDTSGLDEDLLKLLNNPESKEDKNFKSIEEINILRKEGEK